MCPRAHHGAGVQAERQPSWQTHTHTCTHTTAYKPECGKWSTTENPIWRVRWMRDIRKPYLPNGGTSCFLSSSAQRPGHYSEVISAPLMLNALKGLLLSCLPCLLIITAWLQGSPGPTEPETFQAGSDLRDHLEGIRVTPPGALYARWQSR